MLSGTSVQAAVWYDKLPESGEYYPVDERNVPQPQDFEDVNSGKPGAYEFPEDAAPSGEPPAVTASIQPVYPSFVERYGLWLAGVLVIGIAAVAFILKRKSK